MAKSAGQGEGGESAAEVSEIAASSLGRARLPLSPASRSLFLFVFRFPPTSHLFHPFLQSIPRPFYLSFSNLNFHSSPDSFIKCPVSPLPTSPLLSLQADNAKSLGSIVVLWLCHYP